MSEATEVSITLEPELYQRLCDESRKLGIAIEWLVASLVVDTLESRKPRLAVS